MLEREFAGFGASGRNGGWLSGLLAGSREEWAKRLRPRRGDRRAAGDVRRPSARSPDWCEAQGVDCDLVRSGQLDVATSAPRAGAAARARRLAALLGLRRGGLARGRPPARSRVGVRDARGGVFTPHCARVHPAKLVRGLADAVERAGVTILEDTEVTAIEPGVARTARGDVRARWVVRATEGYTHGLAPRRLIPMNSAMVVTEPVDVEWPHEEALREYAHLYCYLQRTADGRIAIGGRGIPYRYGSRTDRNGEIAPQTVNELTGRLERLFGFKPEIVHGWAGVLGVSRDWCPAVVADHDSGLASAGGYVGDGVSTANLAGRTLRDLMLGRDTELARAPWTRHVPKRWEPEPLRWLGVRMVYGLYRVADAREERTQKPSPLGTLATRISGR